MARIFEPTTEQQKEWKRWVKSRPTSIRKIAGRFEPWSLYRHKETGQRVLIQSFSEDGTVTMIVSAQYNFVLFEKRVFGVDPSLLEPCDLPEPDELVGTMLTQEQVENNLDILRVHVRPDLWVLDADGKAVRRN